MFFIFTIEFLFILQFQPAILAPEVVKLADDRFLETQLCHTVNGYNKLNGATEPNC